MYDLLRPTAEGSIKAFGAAICQAGQMGMEFFTDGNREQAAKILGIGARTLYRKLKEYELS